MERLIACTRPHRALALLAVGTALLTTTNGVHAAAEWRAERVNGEVTVSGAGALNDGAPVTPNADLRLDAEDTALTLWRDGLRLRLRGPSHITLYGTGDGGTPRVHLQRGATRAQVPSNTALLVNAGALRLQLRGAEAWMAADADSDRVCALDGRVKVQVAGVSDTLELNSTGHCLVRTADGQLREEYPDRSVLNRRLARADGGVAPLPVTFTPKSIDTSALIASAVALHELPSEAPATGNWFVVIGAFSDRAAAQQAQQRFSIPDSRVRTAENRPVHRVLVGPFPDRVAAQSHRERLVERFPGAWLLESTNDATP